MSRQRTKAADISDKPRKAIIAAIENGTRDDVEESLDELVLLLENLKIPTAARVVQKRSTPDPASFIGSGKAAEVKDFAQANGASILVVDDFLTPTQRSSLKKLTSLEVWDRAFVIMKIFESRAHTAEAKLQVELAQYRYEIPSLKGLGHQMSRTGGGIGTRGPGETEWERHRRKLERRIKGITARLEAVRKRRSERRDRRKRNGAPLAALVGYTNSGKSTLLRTLSKDAAILSADQLFSTLDTVARKVAFRDGGSFILSDTVGFIRKLPPELIAAFRATLEESAAADLLLVVLDGAAKDPAKTLGVVLETLEAIEAAGLPRIIVLNKIDKLGSEKEFIMTEMRASGEEVFAVSALCGDGLDELLAGIKKRLADSGAFREAGTAGINWSDYDVHQHDRVWQGTGPDGMGDAEP